MVEMALIRLTIASNTGVTAYLDGSTEGRGGHAEGDVLHNIERLIGSAGNDTLNGSINNDTIFRGYRQ